MQTNFYRRTLLSIWFWLSALFASNAQFGLPQANLTDERPTEFILKNITLVAAPGQVLANSSIYVKNGKIISVGATTTLPKSVIVLDGKGFWLYPSFIEIQSSYGIPATPPRFGPGNGVPVYESKKSGSSLWNMALMPEFQAASVFTPNDKEAEDWRKNGFGWVVSSSSDGIFRGTGSLVATGVGTPNQLIYKPAVLQVFSFSKGSSPQAYPSSQMGSIALIRQTLMDAQWYDKVKKKSGNLGLEALIANKGLPVLFETGQKYEALRAVKLAKEFNLNLIIKGKGDEYQRMDDLKASGFPLVIPLQFPELPDVEDPLDANLIGLAELKHWELAPHNGRLLAQKGVPFAFTTKDLKDSKSFLSQFRKVVENGLSESDALAALTTRPALILGVQNEIGQLKPGMSASFFMITDNLFKPQSQIVAHWIQGRKFEISPIPETELAGLYRFKIGADSTQKLRISFKEGKPELTLLILDTQKVACQGSVGMGKLSFSAQLKKLDTIAKLQFTGWQVGKNFSGWLQNGTNQITWAATRLAEPDTSGKKGIEKKEKAADIPGQIWFPFQAYGSTDISKATDFVIRNGTIWTNESAGILENADVWVSAGKIQTVGKKLVVPVGTKEFDATGKHVTTGIIDEHSHIAISRGVNEGGSTTSPEVRIGDVVEADDINIYRHLAGGVTAVQQLHGSANSIGGQSSMVKLKWGMTPDQMKVQGAAPFNKFALGENVKQSNWGSEFNSRYPQTRMGVEQLLYDAFIQAKRYREEEKKAISSKTSEPFRRDLKLEALAEILESKRFITCHSYVQSEINMLMHVADSMGFKINTFTHILEGYKVADKMKKHGAGASTFADWWAYKMEVKDAIPFNAALMQKAGLVVAINSDDAEMARRLNQEAAKTVKYGGVSEEDAWKMVTLNPAKLLHLDKRMGSMVAGKDADLVIWSANPLSIDAHAEKTIIEGIVFYDFEQSKELDTQNKTERQRIIQKMLKAKKDGQPAVPAQPKTQHLWHCDDLGEE